MSLLRAARSPERQYVGVSMRAGLPPRWQEIADTLRTNTGRSLLLRPTEDPFAWGPENVEVHLDGELLGAFEFWGDDEDLEASLTDLREALGVYLDEEVRTEDW